MASDTPDPTKMLKQDHDEVEKLLEQLCKARDTDRRQALFGDLEPMILLHARLEEQAFYPAFKEASKRKDDRIQYYESKEEHDAVERLLVEMHASDPGSERFQAQAMLLKELVLHHAKEEEKTMFPRTKEILKDDAMEDLSRRMQRLRKELEQKDLDGLRKIEPPARTRHEESQKSR